MIIKRSKKSKGVLVCPKCFKPYRPAADTISRSGLLGFTGKFKCKWCGYSGPGPIKLVEEK